MDITLNTAIPTTSESYPDMQAAVNAHNEAAQVGETLWCIAERDGQYIVDEYGVKAEPEEVSDEPTIADRLEAIEEAIAELALMSIAEPDADTADTAEADNAETAEEAEANG